MSEPLPVPPKSPELLDSAELKPGEDLDPQLRMFCHEYLVDYNPARAAKTVGKPGYGRRLMRDPRIRKFLTYLQEEVEQYSLISKAMVEHEILNEALPRARGEVEIEHFDKDLGQVAIRRYDAQAHTRLIDQMAKHSGFVKDHKQSRPVVVNFNLAALVGSDVVSAELEPGDVIEGEIDDSVAE